MSFEEISNILINAKRPIDVFGDVDLVTIKKTYKSMIKICHPDLFNSNDKSVAEKVTILLNDFYKKAIDEFKKGIYNSSDEKEILESNDVLFEFTLKGKKYSFYKYFESEDTSDVYEGTVDSKLILLKLVCNEEDNDLLIEEYNTLKELDHPSLPKVITKVRINNKIGIIFDKPSALSISELKRLYGFIPSNHVCWMMERMLSLIGYLHENKIVHGNIKEENVLIDPETHNVIIKDYSLCIKNANERDSKYKIINDNYTPDYVSKDSKVIPNADIYAVGKIAINLLGGDIKRVALPLSTNVEVRNFIRKLLSRSENDAWKLWSELIQIRNDVYGTKRFQKLELKRK